MLQYGLQITKAGDPLQKINLQRLFLGISKPKQGFRDLIEQLRMVRSMDEKQYKELKKQLPYFVCGIFQPPIRRKEHFALTHYFILDIDHLERANLSVETTMENLQQTPNVALLFKSPSGDGLKVLFRLTEPCSDQSLFSAFYKLFASRFAEKNGLQEVIDYRTSDVTRACFLSFDANAYFNPNSEPIDMALFIPDLDFAAAEKDLKAANTLVKKAQVAQNQQDRQQMDDEVLQKIKAKLHPKYNKPKKKNYFVPPQIDKALAEISDQLQTFDLQLIETQPISYGRKMKIANAGIWAELNIFYGKKGFKVVKTTKTGSNATLADLATQVIDQILATVAVDNKRAD